MLTPDERKHPLHNADSEYIVALLKSLKSPVQIVYFYDRYWGYYYHLFVNGVMEDEGYNDIKEAIEALLSRLNAISK
ncbi:MAG: hypothetical protein IGS54_25840 [Elainella sp. C42_A2020_010]|nr:hypothetical protein [Elainella sp. C42_A2020_010]